MKHKYAATRCTDSRGVDMEWKEFTQKRHAVRWADACRYGRVRRAVEGRPIVFSKGY